MENSSKIRKGKVLLLDIGAEYGGYNADITRTVFCSEPPKQSERVYDAVHRTLKSSVKFFKPGSSIKEVNGKVAGLIEAELLELGLITSNDIKNQNSGNPAYRKYYMHGASHYLGLDVHDPGKRDRKLEPGMILTLEPGIYVPEWETGVRLEEDLLITKDGCEVLSKNIPLNWKNLVK